MIWIINGWVSKIVVIDIQIRTCYFGIVVPEVGIKGKDQ